MIITINIDELRNKIYDIGFFKDFMKITVKNIFKTLNCKITRNTINIINIPNQYINFIGKTIEKILNSEDFWNEYDSYVYQISLNNKNFKMLDLLFDMFGVNTKDQSKFLQKLDNIQIGYNEDLHFITKSPLENNINSRVIQTKISNDAYFYKIQHNSNIESNSAIKIFKNLNLKINDYKIIDNPKDTYSFQIILDDDLESYVELLYVYDKNVLLKYNDKILDNYKNYSVQVKLFNK